MLRGLGTAIALPVLDSMIPTRVFGAEAKAAAKPSRRRAASLGFMCRTEFTWRTGRRLEIGSAYALTPTLQPLAPFRDKMTVLSGWCATKQIPTATAREIMRAPCRLI